MKKSRRNNCNFEKRRKNWEKMFLILKKGEKIIAVNFTTE
jgi:hypothetical protein